ncbi:MAG: histidine utilization repressor [Proteobacteria bacterium]|nr:histidine utilization repressor [Pseudomonadota bacterium]
MASPHYAKIKTFVKQRISAGRWLPGHLIPSENELTRQFKVSRMTVNRALRELSSEGFLHRVQGLGTFVAELTPVSSLLKIRDIREEIAERGHRHRAMVKFALEEPVTREVAALLEVEPRSTVFRTVLVHYENGVPVQLEDRFVNPAFAPDLLKIDFTRETPSHYLFRVAPLAEAEQVVEACAPDAFARRLLRIGAQEPCLIVRRRTWGRSGVVAYAVLTHPGSRYRLMGRFKP